MALQLSDGFRPDAYEPLDVRQVLTLAQMKTITGDEYKEDGSDFVMPYQYYFVYCIDDNSMYMWDYEATPSAETGKFKKVEGSAGAGVDSYSTKADMKSASDAGTPTDGQLGFCAEDGALYRYSTSNPNTPDTGKFAPVNNVGESASPEVSSGTSYPSGSHVPGEKFLKLPEGQLYEWSGSD